VDRPKASNPVQPREQVVESMRAQPAARLGPERAEQLRSSLDQQAAYVRRVLAAEPERDDDPPWA
jgi:hypothetical protein